MLFLGILTSLTLGISAIWENKKELKEKVIENLPINLNEKLDEIL